MATSNSITTMKCCAKCGTEYPSTPEFFRFRNGRLTLPCKKCNQESHQAWFRENGVQPARRAVRTDTHIQCIKCEQWKPKSVDFFRVRKGQFMGRCIDCERIDKEKRRRERGVKPAKRSVIADGFMRCSNCGISKPATREYFALNRTAKSGLSSKCRECRKQYLREFRRKPEQIIAEKEYRQRPEIKLKKNLYYKSDQGKEATRRYRKTSSKHKAYVQSQKYSEMQRTYARSDRGKQKARLNSGRRRARQIGKPDSFTMHDWQIALDYFDHRCAVCGRPIGLWHNLAQDHWIPISNPDCPGTIPTNIVPLCQGQGGCNNSKNNNEAFNWLINKFGKRKAARIMKRIQGYFDWLKHG